MNTLIQSVCQISSIEIPDHKLKQAGESPEVPLEKLYNAVVDAWSFSKDFAQLKEVHMLSLAHVLT